MSYNCFFFTPFWIAIIYLWSSLELNSKFLNISLMISLSLNFLKNYWMIFRTLIWLWIYLLCHCVGNSSRFLVLMTSWFFVIKVGLTLARVGNVQLVGHIRPSKSFQGNHGQGSKFNTSINTGSFLSWSFWMASEWCHKYVNGSEQEKKKGERGP